MAPDAPSSLKLRALQSAFAAFKFWIARDVYRDNERLRAEIEKTEDAWYHWREKHNAFEAAVGAALERCAKIQAENDRLVAENAALKAENARLRKAQR